MIFLFKIMKKKMILIIGLIIYLIIAFVSEIFFREPLYKKSVEYMRKMKQNKFLDFFYFFWSYFFLFFQMFCGGIFTFFMYPINIFFCNFSYELIYYIYIKIIICFSKTILGLIYRKRKRKERLF